MRSKANAEMTALTNADCSYRAQKCNYAQPTGQWYEKPLNISLSLLRWHADLFIWFRRLAHLSWSLLTGMPIQ